MNRRRSAGGRADRGADTGWIQRHSRARSLRRVPRHVEGAHRAKVWRDGRQCLRAQGLTRLITPNAFSPRSRIVVLGHSLGATLAPRIAAEDPTLAGIIIMAGATRPLVDVMRDQMTYLPRSLRAPAICSRPAKAKASRQNTSTRVTFPMSCSMTSRRGPPGFDERHPVVAAESRRRVRKLSRASLLAPARKGSLRTGSWRLHSPISRPRPHAARGVMVIRSAPHSSPDSAPTGAAPRAGTAGWCRAPRCHPPICRINRSMPIPDAAFHSTSARRGEIRANR